MSNFNKSDIKDHATIENYIIDWDREKIFEKEPNKHPVK